MKRMLQSIKKCKVYSRKKRGADMKKLYESRQAPVSVRQRIYQNLYDKKSFCSRQTLAAECGVSLPTLYQNLNELMHDGLVRYSGEEQSTGGRRAQGLEIVPDARIAAGISVTEDTLRLVASDLLLNELAYRSVPFDLYAFLDEKKKTTSLAEILSDFLDDFSLPREKLLGVGITIPGVLSPDHLRISIAPTLNLRDVPLSLLTDGIPYPVYADNDGSASGYAEGFIRGGAGNMAYISLEVGIGGAVMIGGVPYAGDNSRSGEFGHICVEPGGLKCSCGKLGCLEAYCSAKRIEDEFGVSLEEFFEGVEAHNPEYENLLYNMLRHLAKAICSIRMTLDCDIVLSGFFSEYLQPYLPVLREYVIAENPFSEPADFVQLSRLRKHITPLGAALYHIRSFIADV